MTADEWAGEEYRQQRRKTGCRRGSAVVLVVFSTIAVLIRKGLKR